MKKKILMALLCGTMTASLFTGCGKSDSIEQTKDKMKVEAGDTFNFKVSDYFKHSNGDAIGDDEYKLDATAVNTDKVGEYTVKVTFGTGNDAKDYKVKVAVQDTVAPEIKAKGDVANSGYTYVNDMSTDMSQYVDATDITDLKYSTKAEKLGDLAEVNDQSIAGYLEQVKTVNDAEAAKQAEASKKSDKKEDKKADKKDATEKTDGTEKADGTESAAQTADDLKNMGEGFYLTTVTATDAGGNTADVSFLVICDKTAPVVSYNGQQLADGSTIELEKDINDASEVVFDVTDNTRGKLADGDYTKTLDKSNGYSFKIDAGDSAGNQTSISVNGNVKKQEVAENSSSGSNSSANKGSGKNNGGSKKNNTSSGKKHNSSSSGGSSAPASNPENGDNTVSEPANNNVQYGVIQWDSRGAYEACYKTESEANAAADAFVKNKLGSSYTGNWDGGGWEHGVYYVSGITARIDNENANVIYDMRPNVAKAVSGSIFNESTWEWEDAKDISW